MIIYDIEIKCPPLPKKVSDRLLSIRYAPSWTHYKQMEIACIAAYDYVTDTYSVYDQKMLREFQELMQQRTLYIGFNNIKFDNKILKAFNVDINYKWSYDILKEIQKCLGFVKGCRLDDCIKANFKNAGKNGDGAEAPILWQRGEYTRVINYCLNDVRLTKMLLDRIIRNGWIINPLNPSDKLFLPRPN